MNKVILRKNIEQVIMQPCNAKYPERVVPNGLSEDAKHFFELGMQVSNKAQKGEYGMKTTLITDKCYACEYEGYCNGSYCCLKNSRFTETIIDKTQENED